MQTLPPAAKQRLMQAVKRTISRLMDFEPENKRAMQVRRDMASIWCEWNRVFDYLHGFQIAQRIEVYSDCFCIMPLRKHWAIRASYPAQFAESLWLEKKDIKR